MSSKRSKLDNKSSRKGQKSRPEEIYFPTGSDFSDYHPYAQSSLDSPANYGGTPTDVRPTYAERSEVISDSIEYKIKYEIEKDVNSKLWSMFFKIVLAILGIIVPVAIILYTAITKAFDSKIEAYQDKIEIKIEEKLNTINFKKDSHDVQDTLKTK